MPLTDTEASSAFNIQFNFAAPQPERSEAKAALIDHYASKSTAAGLVEILPQGAHQAQQWISQIEKAQRMNRQMVNGGTGKMMGGRDTLTIDPNGTMIDVFGLRGKRMKFPGHLSRQIARQSPILASIMSHLRNETAAFAELVEPSHAAILAQQEGFDIVIKGRPMHEQPVQGDDEWEEKQAAVQFILNNGDRPRFPTDGGKSSEDLKRETFDALLQRLTDDRWIIAANAVERQKTYGGALSGIYSVDADSIYYTLRPGEVGYDQASLIHDNPRALYAQVYNRQVYTLLASDQMLYENFNTSTDPLLNGYGVSETELSIRLTTAILNVLNSANAQFDRNAMPEGFLFMSGYVGNDEALSYFTDEWNAYRLGTGGDFGLPMLAFRDKEAKAQFVSTGKQLSDMGYEKYANFSIALNCGIFGVDVQAINASPIGGNNSNLNSGKNSDSRAAQSRGRGFLPHMANLRRFLNKAYNPVLGPKWELVFRGLVKQDPTFMAEAYMSVHDVDEIRHGLFASKPKGGIVGASLAKNPAISQLVLAALSKGTVASEEITGS